MITALTRILYSVSNALLVPVIVGLLVLFAWTVMMLGGLLKEWVERGRVRRAIEAALQAARGDADSLDVCRELSRAGSGLPSRFARFADGAAPRDGVLDHVVARLEHDVADSVARHSFVTRVSPMLGLMGTLIPLGPALSGLAAGDMAALSGNLVVAFTATVVGLLISGAAYGVGLVRRVWYSRDLTDLEFIAKRLAGGTEDATT